jgi:peptide/nickel transport system permease protein
LNLIGVACKNSPEIPKKQEAKLAQETPLQRFLSDFRQSRLALSASIVFLLIVLFSLFAPYVTPQDPYDMAKLEYLDGRCAPGSRGHKGFVYWLGSDDQGRDMLSAIVYGLRTSLLVGVLSTVVASLIGVSLGLFSAYSGGRMDSLLMRIVDMQVSFPAILIALILMPILGRGISSVILALIIAKWAYYTRIMRGVALAERSRQYIKAAQCLGLHSGRIIFRHLLPNCLPSLIVVSTLQLAHAIALEATLSFLGVGVPVNKPSLGLLISNGFEYMLSGQYWICFYPGIALLVTIVSINLMGDHLRDILNPRLQK